MKFNRIILIGFLLLAIMTLGAVSAANETAGPLTDYAADNIRIDNDVQEVLSDNIPERHSQENHESQKIRTHPPYFPIILIINCI